MMSFYGTPFADLDAAIAADPAWPLPRVMKAGFLLSLTEPSLAGAADALLDEAAAARRPSNDRERDHHAALRSLGAGDAVAAGERWESLLRRHPRDALALQWLHLLDFYRGDAAQLRGHVEAVLPAWCDDDPLQPYVLALHAFGLEESGRYGEAEATRPTCAGRRGTRAVGDPRRRPRDGDAGAPRGRRALDGARRRDWGAREGEGSDGEAERLRRPPRLARSAVRARRLDTDTALRVFDDYLDASRIEITLQRVDAAALLWRLRLLGADVGDRWQRLIAAWPLDATAAGRSVFNDAHATMALIGAGEKTQAQDWVALCIDEAERRAGRNPTCRASWARRSCTACSTSAPAATPPRRRRSRRCAIGWRGSVAATRSAMSSSRRCWRPPRTAPTAPPAGAARGATRARPASPLTEWWSRRARRLRGRGARRVRRRESRVDTSPRQQRPRSIAAVRRHRHPRAHRCRLGVAAGHRAGAARRCRCWRSPVIQLVVGATLWLRTRCAGRRGRSKRFRRSAASKVHCASASLRERSAPDPMVAAFVEGLRDLGYVEGRNIVIERRYALGADFADIRISSPSSSSSRSMCSWSAAPSRASGCQDCDDDSPDRVRVRMATRSPPVS